MMTRSLEAEGGLESSVAVMRSYTAIVIGARGSWADIMLVNAVSAGAALEQARIETAGPRLGNASVGAVTVIEGDVREADKAFWIDGSAGEERAA